ncbi:MAG: flagellar biosynthesis protein FlhA [Rhodobacter sp.]|uniref:flagellar biosynthesis protein FlhA n=1 Tax=Pararhodobacter sp. TaxID=2127056 RepID=UPI001D52C8AB|nr:flagellar biosynthesis protein FlhA [Pararhodobacter sp.]MCB1345757.1 flagellar biosynthesis protein FlhA [Paracoccaceae bacterium]MCC0074426.1 flagellar biosynthesis protein FlhA [Rhodobacter sp.]HPD91406.1 flagellar biosynthesis protein FlhA [Pararhodobacter sp.]
MTFSAARLFQPTVLLALALMAVIVMMILPMPSWMLDIGLAASFALAILMFTITLFIERPLDFSIFPTVLLASLMLRLSLNVSSTRLIIGQGHTGPQAAGSVIQGFASFIMGGSVFLGVVVFSVLLIVNFIVITKGAGRMAEVGARFALDGMPGKQLAIDADMAAGAISHAEAKARREREQQETTFFGSLDGASKFVKGDAVAGLLITSMNIVFGLLMGTLVHGMPIGEAFETYAILTVGDGLVSQIPAVIISIAAALLLARGGANGATDTALMAQLGRYPAALVTVALLMALFALVPGLPFLPFVAGAAILGTAGWFAHRHATRPDDPIDDAPVAKLATLGDVLDLDEIHVTFAPDLVPMVLDPATGLDARIVNMRNHIARNFGLILPEIRLTDDPALRPGEYAILVQGVEQARDRLHPDRRLALLPDGGRTPPGLDGLDVHEPVFAAPARWIAPADEEAAALDGLTVVGPAEVLATHLLEVLKTNFARLLSLRGLRRMLDEMTQLTDPRRAEANRRLIDELIPDKVPVDLLLSVLRLLLDERVSIRNLPMILESIAELRVQQMSPEAVCDHVRQRLGFQLVAGLKRADGTLPLVQLAPEWEDTFARYQIEGERGGTDIALPPADFGKLANALAQTFADLADKGTQAALVSPARRRRFLRTVMAARDVPAPVLAFEEIGMEARPALVGQVAA